MTGAASITLEDVLAATRAVALRLMAGEDAAIAARRLCDQAQIARAHRAATARAHPLFGDGSLAAAASADAARDPRGMRPDCVTTLRAAAAVCRVLAGDAPHPLATGFH